MRFAILASPGSDPGDARGRASAVTAVDDPASVATAARACSDPFVLLLAAGMRPRASAFGGFAALDGERLGVLGAAVHGPRTRSFGFMLAPAAFGPLPFELVPITAPSEEAGVDARVRGPIDAVAPGMILAARELLLEPLPSDAVAAAVELCARARAAGRGVVCRPSFACDGPPEDADDRGRIAALRALAARRPELTGTYRLPAGLRRAFVELDLRLPGGRRTRARAPLPPLTVIAHGAGAELAARRARDLAPRVTAHAVAGADAALRALRDELHVRGERYVLLCAAESVPDHAAFDALAGALASAPYAALAAPSAAALDGACVLAALARIPQHVEAAGETLAGAVSALAAAAGALRRAVRAPGFQPVPAAAPRERTATVVFAASSSPEILRLTATALVESTRAGDEVVAVIAAGAATTRKIVSAYPQLRTIDDAVDPLLGSALNRAAGDARGDLVVMVADDVLLTRGALDRLRDAFARVPALGAAFPAVPGAAGGEGVLDAEYGDLASLHTLAERRALEREHELEPIDVAVSPVFAVTREALAVVGGIDPAHGPTRRGIADLVARLRGAGYVVARCDDALVHRFDAALSHNPAAAADARQPAPLPDGAAIARGFDPARRVPFVRAASDAPVTASHAVALPVGGPAELERAAVFLAAAAAAFDAASPVRVHLLLDGTVTPADAVARVRPALAAGGRAMDDTLAVRVERSTDLGAWLAGVGDGVRVVRAAGHDRDALASLDAVDARTVAALLHSAAG